MNKQRQYKFFGFPLKLKYSGNHPIKDQNFESQNKDLHHSSVERYELAPKRHVDIKGSGPEMAVPKP